MILQEVTRPTIKILCQRGLSDISQTKQLLYGIEEEGIPFEIAETESSDAEELAYKACSSSILGTGIGVAEGEIVLQYEKLSKDHPIFRIPMESDAESIRNLGANGARLVKKMPFKKIGGGEV